MKPETPATTTTTADWAGRAAVVVVVILASYWKIVDCETYMRLAIGRFTAQAGLSADADPFIYSIPGLRWRNPEWLGDLLLWGTYRLAGEGGLVALKLALFSVGWVLMYQLARRRGGSPLVVVALAMVVLAGSEWHMGERNELHLHWLVPAYGLVLDRGRHDRRWFWALLPLGLLWANLHGSFKIGWLLIGAALAEALFGEARDRALVRPLIAALVVHPLLPFLGPEGLRAYDLVIDHARYSGAIQRLIKEWLPPDREPATIAQLPLHVLGLIGLVSFLPRPNRRQVGGFIVFAAGYYSAVSAQRFLLLFGLLALPVIAGNLERTLPLLAPRVARLALAILVAGGIALVAPAVFAARRMPHAADQKGFPAQASAWIGAHAPPRSRLFMPYTGAQWLMWRAPQVGLYITPHFSFGSDHMVRFFEEILPRPDRFEAEVRRLDINLALADLVGESKALSAHLAAAPDWPLVYFDGFYALHARRVPANEALIAAHAYQALRPAFSFEGLAAAPDDVFAADLRRLESQSPILAGAARAVRLLRRDATPSDPRPRDWLLRAIAELPSNPALLAYLVEAHLRAGDRAAAATALRKGLGQFPRSPRLQKLADQLR